MCEPACRITAESELCKFNRGIIELSKSKDAVCGFIEFDTDSTAPITENQLLFKHGFIRNTEFVYGIAIEQPIPPNSLSLSFKRTPSLAENQVSKYRILLLKVSAFLSILSAIFIQRSGGQVKI